MDANTFDRLMAEAARRPTRRSTLRLLAGGFITALLPARGAAAQRPDRDGDGLFDDDEVNLYGTNPDLFDTDGEGRATARRSPTGTTGWGVPTTRSPRPVVRVGQPARSASSTAERVAPTSAAMPATAAPAVSAASRARSAWGARATTGHGQTTSRSRGGIATAAEFAGREWKHR